MKKKDLLKRINEMDHEILMLKMRIITLESSKPIVTNPEPQKLPINPLETWKPIPPSPPYIVYC